MKFRKYRNLLELSSSEKKHRLSMYDDFIQFIRRHIKGRCLEIGCGDGAWTGLLKEKADSLVSIDLSEGRVKRAREAINNHGVNFIVSDARSLPFPDSSFDTVCAIEVIEHLPSHSEHSKFISEVKRVLAAAGTLIISTPNKPFFKIYCLILNERDFTHFSELNYFQFNRILRRNFSSVKIYGRFGWFAPLYNKFIAARIIHAFLSKLAPLCKGLVGICRK